MAKRFEKASALGLWITALSYSSAWGTWVLYNALATTDRVVSSAAGSGDTPSCPHKFGVSAFSATEAATERQNFLGKKFWKSKIFVCEVLGR